MKLRAPGRIVLDFDQPRDSIRSLLVGEKPIVPAFAHGHLTIPAAATQAGENAIAIEFIAGDAPLNRNDGFYVYTFRPRARASGFPLFRSAGSQGAVTTLELEIPGSLAGSLNGRETERVAASA